MSTLSLVVGVPWALNGLSQDMKSLERSPTSVKTFPSSRSDSELVLEPRSCPVWIVIGVTRTMRTTVLSLLTLTTLLSVSTLL